MTTGNVGIIAAIVSYMCFILRVGYTISKQNEKSSEGFYLGGRKLGPFVAAMSAEASDMSSWLLMGLPGVAYFTGLADAAWTAIGLGIGTYLNWLLVAKRLRAYSIKLDAITVPDFFSKRFHDRKNIIILISSVIIVVFFVPYTASGFKAVGTLFSTLFGFDYHAAMIAGAAIIITYTILGGFLAVATIDLIQSIVMSIALLIIVAFGIYTAGGWDAVVANATSIGGYLSLTHITDVSTGTVSDYGFLKILSTLAWGLGYFGMPHVLVRFMAMSDGEDIKLSRRVATSWVFISMAVAILIGFVGNACSANGAIRTFRTNAEAETTIISLAHILSENSFALALVAGIVIAGILACTMSTADSQLLVAASAVSENLIQDFFKVRLTQKQSMTAARIVIIAIAVISVFLAWNPNSSVFTIVSFAWAGFGATFGPVMLLALFNNDTNLNGVVAGMVASGVTVFAWKFLVKPLGGIWNIYELLPAFLVGVVVIIAVSKLTGGASREIKAEFAEISARK